GSGESFAEGLRAMGADGVTVGLALMEDAWEPWPNPYRVIERLKKIAPADRLDVMVKSGLLAKPANWPLSADIRDLLRAYIWEGRSGEDATLLLPDPISPDLPRQRAEIPAGFEPFAEPPAGAAGAPSAKSIIALHDVLDAMDEGPDKAAWVLARLQ